MRISDWSSDVCSSDLLAERKMQANQGALVVSDDMRLLDAEHFEKTARVFDNQIVCEPDLAGGGIGAALPQRVERHDPEVLGENPKVSFPGEQIPAKQIGRASCRERVCQYV